MNNDQVPANLQGMDDLDFTGWNNADWHSVFAHHHTDDVLVDWKGQPVTHGIDEHIDAMKAYVESGGGHAATDHLAPDQVRIGGMDVRGRRVRGRRPHGDRRPVAERRHRRGIHLVLTRARFPIRRIYARPPKATQTPASRDSADG